MTNLKPEDKKTANDFELVVFAVAGRKYSHLRSKEEATTTLCGLNVYGPAFDSVRPFHYIGSVACKTCRAQFGEVAATVADLQARGDWPDDEDDVEPDGVTYLDAGAIE